MKTTRLAAFSLLALGVMLTTAWPDNQDSTNKNTENTEKKSTDLQRKLIGAWVLVGSPGDVHEPEPGARMKFWGEKHWVITQADPETGKVIFHHGGTYTLDGDKYTETITFANENTQQMIGEKLRFTVSVEDDTYTQIGDGNPFSEVWKRLER